MNLRSFFFQKCTIWPPPFSPTNNEAQKNMHKAHHCMNMYKTWRTWINLRLVHAFCGTVISCIMIYRHCKSDAYLSHLGTGYWKWITFVFEVFYIHFTASAVRVLTDSWCINKMSFTSLKILFRIYRWLKKYSSWICWNLYALWNTQEITFSLT